MTHIGKRLAASPPSPPSPPETVAETVDVRFGVLGVEPVRGRGALVALAIVELDVAGVALTLQGVQVRRLPSGGFECASPVWRHPVTGAWLPGVLLPDELKAALAAEVVAAWRETV